MSKVTRADLDWLRDYALQLAICADQDTVASAKEQDAASADYDRAAQLFDALAALIDRDTESGDQ